MTARKATSRTKYRSTAIHEAGHAVIGRVLGLSCGSATIVLNRAENEAGHAEIFSPWRTLDAWDQRLQEEHERGVPEPKCKSGRSAFRGSMLALMAGAEAQRVILSETATGDGDDRTRVEMMAESRDAEISEDEWKRFEPRMRRHSQRLIRRHRAVIERVADELLKRRTLTAEEIDALL